MFLRPLSLAAALALAPLAAQAAPIQFGPGNGSTPTYQYGLLGFSYPYSGTTVPASTFAAGNYIVDTYSAAFTHYFTNINPTQFTPLVAEQIPFGIMVLAVGDTMTISADAAYQSYRFGGSNSFGLSSAGVLMVGFFTSGGGFRLPAGDIPGFSTALSGSVPGGVHVGDVLGAGLFFNGGAAPFMAIGISDVPEPAGFVVLAVGMCGLAAARRRARVAG